MDMKTGEPMHSLERLKRDHELLRGKLTVLESALEVGQAAGFVLLQVVVALKQLLADHTPRERELLRAARQLPGTEGLSPVAMEHGEELVYLARISYLLSERPSPPIAAMRPAVTLLARRLRERMQLQEVRLFPILERIPAAPQFDERIGGIQCIVLTETMTVNRTLAMFPETREVFEALRVSFPFEQYDALDEVAWRRGMESGELLTRLEQVVARHP